MSTTSTPGDLTPSTPTAGSHTQELHPVGADMEGAQAVLGCSWPHTPWWAIITIIGLILSTLIILALCASTPLLLAAEGIELVAPRPPSSSKPSRNATDEADHCGFLGRRPRH